MSGREAPVEVYVQVLEDLLDDAGRRYARLEAVLRVVEQERDALRGAALVEGRPAD